MLSEYLEVGRGKKPTLRVMFYSENVIRINQTCANLFISHLFLPEGGVSTGLIFFMPKLWKNHDKRERFFFCFWYETKFVREINNSLFCLGQYVFHMISLLTNYERFFLFAAGSFFFFFFVLYPHSITIRLVKTARRRLYLCIISF